MHAKPEQPENSGVPQWFYPALGLPQTPEPEAPPPHETAPPQPGPQGPGRPRRWEKAVAACLAVAFIFLLGWWWGARRSESGAQGPLELIGAAPTDNSLAGLGDDELFELLPTQSDYPRGWRVTRARGASISGSGLSSSRIDPPECDLRKAAKPADTVGSVRGESPQLMLIHASSAEIRLSRDPQGQGPFAAAEDFATRCPRVTISARGQKAVMRLTTQRDTIPEASESMTITMAGNIDSGEAIPVPVVLTMTGARARGLVVIGSGMKAGLSLSFPSFPQEDSELADDVDVAQELIRGTVRRIKAK